VNPHSGSVPAKGLCFEAGIPGANCKVMELYGLRTLFLSIGSLVLGPGMTSTRSISVAPLPLPATHMQTPSRGVEKQSNYHSVMALVLVFSQNSIEQNRKRF
jgi:hypothetical protein